MNSRQVICLLDGVMYCPPNRNGSMPVVQERPRLIPRERPLSVRMRIIIGMVVAQRETILNKLAMWGNMRPTRGAFLICTEMSGSGPRMLTKLLIHRATLWSILLILGRRARFGSDGVVPGSASGRTCVQLGATASPPVAATAT